MYISTAFKEQGQSKLFDFMKNNSFGILFSQDENGPIATHLPFVVEENNGDNGVLIGHLAKANPHWQSIQNKEILIVFSGPHAYISPSWYEEEHTVPTWNYVSVHVTGTFRVIQDQERAQEIIEKSVHYYEAGMSNPWKAEFDDSYIKGLMNGLVCFEIEISKIEGQWKLSQNHSVQRQEKVIHHLTKSSDQKAQQIARWMGENLGK